VILCFPHYLEHAFLRTVSTLLAVYQYSHLPKIVCTLSYYLYQVPSYLVVKYLASRVQ